MEHTHVFHELGIITIVLLSLGILFRERLQELSLMHVITVFLVGIFLLTHVNPGQLLLMSHNSPTSHAQHPPCCMPLVTVSLLIVLIVSFLPLSLSRRKRIVANTKLVAAYSFQNRAPPQIFR